MYGTQGENAVILAIDDEPEVLASLTKVLTTGGYGCHCATDPEAAIRTAREIQPDLIISDINLNGQSGLMLCERMKKEASLTQTPVIFLSGAQIPDVIRRAHNAGGSYYLRKPFDPQVLLELVDKALWMPHVVGSRMSSLTT